MGPKPGGICNYYKKKGHWKNECPKRKRHQENASGSTAVAEDDFKSDEDIALVAGRHNHLADD